MPDSCPTDGLILQSAPDTRVSTRHLFGSEEDILVPAFRKSGPFVPRLDADYQFDWPTTRAILSGFVDNRRVLVQGYHGSGKSTHIEQVAARLRWPCVRINLDSHISRMDLIGRDAIVVRDGAQVTEFREGFLPWALQRPCALVFDEYDAGRPDVMFVIQRVLETDGSLTLPDRNQVIAAHPFFRLFATSNTLGLGDSSGLYHGTQQINQGQLDRWNVFATLNYPSCAQEEKIVLSKVPRFRAERMQEVRRMIQLANLTREAFVAGNLSVVMSPRTVISWAENTLIFGGDITYAFRVTFGNRCEEVERPLLAEYYQRCFGSEELTDFAAVGRSGGVRI